MKTIAWDEMDSILNKKLDQIFNGNVPSNNIEKRKMIFDNLVDNTEYDFELLAGILNRTAMREGLLETIDPLENGKGVCNGISYAYKMLLEKVGIYSMLIACNLKYDQSDVKGLLEKNIKVKQDETGKYVVEHMLTLVENDDKTYSFDDPTCAILDKKNSYFNYDIDMARENKQYDFLGFPADYLNYLVGRTSTQKEINIEKESIDYKNLDGFMKLPNRISRYQEKMIDYEIDER